MKGEVRRGYYPGESDGAEAALEGEAPGLVEWGGAVTEATEVTELAAEQRCRVECGA